jgi:hypothetical protein
MMHAPPPRAFCDEPRRLALKEMDEVLPALWQERREPGAVAALRYRFAVWGGGISLYVVDGKGGIVEPAILKAKLDGRKFLGTLNDGRPTEGEVSADNRTVALAVRKSASDRSVEVRYLECVGP